MALTLYANTGGTITQLNDGIPFKLESAEGLSGSDVVRYEQSGPLQSGATDLGYRLNARVITLRILFYASTAVLLDTYRAALMAAFKPLDNTSTFLSVQRDDSEIRTLSVFAADDIDIALVPEEYPGHLHRATLILRAASPLWSANAATIGSASFSSDGPWWLAGGSVSSSEFRHNIYMAPSYGAVDVKGTGSEGPYDTWTVVMVTARETTADLVSLRDAWVAYDAPTYDGGPALTRGTAPAPGTAGVYHLSTFGSGTGTAVWPGTTDYNFHVQRQNGTVRDWLYLTSGGTMATYFAGSVGASYFRAGTANFAWRSFPGLSINYWAPDIRRGAVFTRTLSLSELNAMAPYAMNQGGGTITLVNDGDVNAYPLITLHGPMIDPIIVNSTTGGTIDLTGGTIGATENWFVDLRDGNKQIYNSNAENKLGSVTTTPVQLASFALAPDPIAAGGTNTIVLYAGSAGTAATYSVQIISQYMSF